MNFFTTKDPIHVIAIAGTGDMMSAKIAGGADPDHRVFPGGVTPLHAAVQAHNVATVRALLDGGANPNASTTAGTALHTAARDGLTEIARLLIAAGAETQAPAGAGDGTPQEIAIAAGHDGVADLCAPLPAWAAGGGAWRDHPAIAERFPKPRWDSI